MTSSCHRGPVWWMSSLVALTVVTIVTINVMDDKPGTNEVIPEVDSPEVQFAQEFDIDAELRRMETLDRISKESTQEEEMLQTGAVKGHSPQKGAVAKGKATKGSAPVNLLSLSESALSAKKEAPSSKNAAKSSKDGAAKAGGKKAKLVAGKKKEAEKKKPPSPPPVVDLSEVTHNVLSAVAMDDGDDDDDEGGEEGQGGLSSLDEDDDVEAHEFSEGIEQMNHNLVEKSRSFSNLALGTHSDENDDIEEEMKKDDVSDLLSFTSVEQQKAKAKAAAQAKAKAKAAAAKKAAKAEAKKAGVHVEVHHLHTNFFASQGPPPSQLQQEREKAKAKAKKQAKRKGAEGKAAQRDDCHPPFCLPSGLESARRQQEEDKAAEEESKEGAVVIKKHRRAELETQRKLESAIPHSIDEFDDTVNAFSVTSEHKARPHYTPEEEAARRHLARMAMEKTLRERKRREQRREEEEREQSEAHQAAMADVARENELSDLRHGARGDGEEADHVESQHLKKAVRKAQQRHFAKTAMESALRQAAKDADLAEVDSYEEEHPQTQDKRSLMHDLLREASGERSRVGADEDLEEYREEEDREEEDREEARQEAQEKQVEARERAEAKQGRLKKEKPEFDKSDFHQLEQSFKHAPDLHSRAKKLESKAHKIDYAKLMAAKLLKDQQDLKKKKAAAKQAAVVKDADDAKARTAATQKALQALQAQKH